MADPGIVAELRDLRAEVARMGERWHILHAYMEASARGVDTLAEEAQLARDHRHAAGEANKAAHEATAAALAGQSRQLEALTLALGDARAQNASMVGELHAAMDAARSTTNRLWGLIGVGSVVLVFLLSALLWLYADAAGSDADRAFGAAGRVTDRLVPMTASPESAINAEEESDADPNPDPE